MSTQIIKYLKDYQAPIFDIESLLLTFDLEETKTRVQSQIKGRRHTGHREPLVLDGEDLVLVSVVLNGQTLTSEEYQYTNRNLTIPEVPDEFVLEITTEMNPAENTQLSGLYVSRHIFCTQCEAEGFRRMTFFFDRPDVMTTFTTKIIADKASYPFLLSNGNCIESGDLTEGRHYAIWQDPFKKPCYLFALVAGNLDRLQDKFVTMSGRQVDLEIYVEKGLGKKALFAMEAIKKAMKWDEQTFGREYDLDRYMVVAISDFNMGAMENKGLNIFNTKYVLANSETATDADYEAILGVIGHEYFHNWSGNRITCRDWFQLSLKEGLTIFREHAFEADMISQTVTRIQNVRGLRTFQFPEDAGPMAHPVQPQSYLQIDNFYTHTVYEKGAEVIRMMETILGKANFRKGMDLYFSHYDGQAVTIHEFVKALSEANHVDLSAIARWYFRPGTPIVTVEEQYDSASQHYQLSFSQSNPMIKDTTPVGMPVVTALFTEKGEKILAKYEGRDAKEFVLNFHENQQTFIFENISEKPIASLFRSFSAPVIVKQSLALKDMLVLLRTDDNLFNRWEVAQKIYLLEFERLLKDWRNGLTQLELSAEVLTALRENLLDANLDPGLIAELLSIPSEKYLASLMSIVDIDGIHAVRKGMRYSIANALYWDFKNCYERSHEATKSDASYDAISAAKRRYKNLCLSYLSVKGESKDIERCMEQYEAAVNMTDRYAALSLLMNFSGLSRQKSLQDFYQRFREDDLVIDKWFSVQALAEHEGVFDDVLALSKHPDFSISNPNRLRSLVGAFSMYNLFYFHRTDGQGYSFLADYVLQLNTLNPQIAARLVEPLIHWKKFPAPRGDLMQAQLKRIMEAPKLSPDLLEVVGRGLGIESNKNQKEK